MNSKSAFFSVTIFAALMGSPFGFTAEEPGVRSSGVVTQVEVREQQVMITAWPENGDPAACRELGRDDFLVEVDGQQVELSGFLTPLVRWDAQFHQSPGPDPWAE